MPSTRTQRGRCCRQGGSCAPSACHPRSSSEQCHPPATAHATVEMQRSQQHNIVRLRRRMGWDGAIVGQARARYSFRKAVLVHPRMTTNHQPPPLRLYEAWPHLNRGVLVQCISPSHIMHARCEAEGGEGYRGWRKQDRSVVESTGARTAPPSQLHRKRKTGRTRAYICVRARACVGFSFLSSHRHTDTRTQTWAHNTLSASVPSCAERTALWNALCWSAGTCAAGACALVKAP